MINIKCKYARKKGECRFYKGKNKPGNGWSAYDGLTVDELKKVSKLYNFCPYYFEKDKSKHSDIVFLPYNYIFDMKIFLRSNLILKNSILIIDEAHKLQDICCDSASTDINTNIIQDIINDLQSLVVYFEENESFGRNIKNADNINSIDLKNEIH